MIKKTIIGLVLICVGWAMAAYTLKDKVEPRSAGVSHLSGLEVGTDGLYTEGAVQYSSANATSTPASMTMKESDFLGYTSIIFTPTGANSGKTITLPASSTIRTMIPSAGDVVDFTIVNASTTGPALTFAGGTGLTLHRASSTLALAATQVAILRMIRLASTDIIAYFSQAY